MQCPGESRWLNPAAGTALAIVNTPYILFHSGKLVDPDLRDRMVEELLLAAMLYLKQK